MTCWPRRCCARPPAPPRCPTRWSRSCWRSMARAWPWSIRRPRASTTAIWPVTGSPPTSTEIGTGHSRRSRTGAKLGPFLVPATLSAPDGTVPAADVDLHLVLGSWRILGAVQQSLEIVTEHVRARIQFGKPLADFQAVRFAVADASVAVRGLHELAKYTICRPESAPAQDPFGGCPDPSAQGRRHRTTGDARRRTSCSEPWASATSPTSACSTGTPSR